MTATRPTGGSKRSSFSRSPSAYVPVNFASFHGDHVDLNTGVIHVWRSASKSGDTKTPQSKRSLTLPKRAINALKEHKKRQAQERLEVGEA